MASRKWLQDVQKVFDELGVKPELVSTRRHYIFNVQTKHGMRRVSISSTPSDVRTLKNFRAQLRRLLETGKRG